MIIIDPVTLGDVACTRASPKSVYDRTGTLVQVSANTLGVTYDPSDLTKAPYPVLEGAATNQLRNSQVFTSIWSQDGPVVTGITAPDGTGSGCAYTHPASTTNYAYLSQNVLAGGDASQDWVFSVWAKVPSGTATLSLSISNVSGSTVGNPTPNTVTTSWARFYFALTLGQLANNGSLGVGFFGTAGQVYHLWGAQLERGSIPSTYIATTSAPVSRAADVIAAGTGLVYSNVAITETAYNAATTYGAGDPVYDPATYAMYQSIAAGNVGNALSNTAKWTPLTAPVNRWKMLDQYNNTQTSNAEEIIIVVSPQVISQGIYLGNLDATEVRISVVDLAEGLVYRETKSLIVSTSASSFYNWCFKPIRKSTYAVSIGLPPYANALITIAIKKPGGTTKCGMCALGPLVDVGLSQYGLGREIKDYSTINFNFDGTSNQVPRNFAKRMDVDVVVDNTQIDFVLEALEQRRQKPVAWIGAKEMGSTCVFGRYSSFKSVVESYPQSKMNLQIEGTV